MTTTRSLTTFFVAATAALVALVLLTAGAGRAQETGLKVDDGLRDVLAGAGADTRVSAILTYDRRPTDAQVGSVLGTGAEIHRFDVLPMLGVSGTKTQIESLLSLQAPDAIYANRKLGKPEHNAVTRVCRRGCAVRLAQPEAPGDASGGIFYERSTKTLAHPVALGTPKCVRCVTSFGVGDKGRRQGSGNSSGPGGRDGGGPLECHEALPGTTVRVREGSGWTKFAGMGGTIERSFGDPEYLALDGRLELFWFHQLDGAEKT